MSETRHHHAPDVRESLAQRCWRAFITFVAGVLILCLVPLAEAQEPSTPQVAPQAEPPAAAPAPAPAQPALPTPPEVIGAIGRFLDKSITTVGEGVNSSVKGAGDAIGATTSAAGGLAKGVGDAASNVTLLPTNVVTGKERCPNAPNGTPDCEPAVTALCKTKGFARGSSLDTQHARKCPAIVYLEGKSDDKSCVTEAFVARAMCQ